jgi:predicted O-methyltransferase YrrM
MMKKELENYILAHTGKEDPLLTELTRETHIKTMFPRMLSGHLQGKFLEMVSQMVSPTTILEIGTFTGYSAICLALGLKEGGLLHTIDVDPELEYLAKQYFEKTKVQDKIVQHIGDAKDIIPSLDYTFDLVFIDADKENYLNYYHLVFDKVRAGGFILADNALWDGKVLLPNGKTDKETRGIKEFNEFVHTDERVENLLLPLRDGIMVLRKK